MGLLGIGGLAYAGGEDSTCPEDACVPWEAPDGGSRTFQFQRPELPRLPPQAQATWTQGKADEQGKGQGVPQLWEDDTVSYNDRVCPVTVSPGGATLSVTIENHLPGLLTTSGSPGMLLNGGLEGSCIELFAQWQWREVIEKLNSQPVVLADGTTVPGPPTEVAYRYKYHWERTCITKVCPC